MENETTDSKEHNEWVYEWDCIYYSLLSAFDFDINDPLMQLTTALDEDQKKPKNSLRAQEESPQQISVTSQLSPPKNRLVYIS